MRVGPSGPSPVASTRVTRAASPASIAFKSAPAQKVPCAPVSTALGDAMDAGELERQPVKPLARLILGALTEASLAIARDPEPAQARIQMGAALTRLIRGLRPAATPAGGR